MVDKHVATMTNPPFELGQYRLIYLEATSTVTRVVVEMDPYYYYKADATERKACQAAFRHRQDQISASLIDILLEAERRGQEGQAGLPSKFAVHGDTYTLLAAQTLWSTPKRWSFSHLDTTTQKKRPVSASPTKWKFMFAPKVKPPMA